MNRRFNLSQWAIDHSVLVVAFYLAILIASILAVGSALPRRMMPYVESPLIGIVTHAPGLTAQEVETYVSKPIEESMTYVSGIRFVRSASQDGFSMVSLEFPYGTDRARALVEVQSVMTIAKGNLPQVQGLAPASWIVPIDPLNLPVLTLGLTAEGWNAVALKEWADNEVVNRFKALRDIQSVFTFGGQKRQLQIILDREKLAAHNLKLADVQQILERNRLATAGGYLLTSESEFSIRLDQQAQDAADLEQLPVVSAQGQTVYLKDIAQVRNTFREQRSGYHFISQGQLVENGVAVQVIQDPAASSPQVIASVMGEIQRLEKETGVHFEVTYDNAHFVDILMENMLEELLLALVLTALAIFFFMGGNWRATLISLIALPVSLAMAILPLVPMGMSLNSSTLIGLLVAIGRLVDDTIIDIHAIQRHLSQGQSIRQAVIEGITEVRLSVAASTLVLIVALVPLLFSGGIVALMFVGLVWPIIFGLAASFLVSLTLTPVLAVHFLKPEPPEQERRPRWLYTYAVHPFERTMQRLEQGYGRLVGRLLRHRLVTMAYVLAALVIGSGFYFFIGGEMMPLADVGQTYGVLETQPGTSYQRTEAIVRQVERLMLEHPEIEKVSTEIGFEPGGTYFTGYGMSQVNGVAFMLTLSDKGRRGQTIWEIIDAVRAKALATIPGIRRFQIKEMGADVMASAQAPISLLVTGKDLHILDRMTQEVASIARATEGMHQVNTSWSMTLPLYEIKPNLQRLRELDLSLSDLASQLNANLRGSISQQPLNLPNRRQNTILLRYAESQRQTLQDLEQVPIITPQGLRVSLKSLAEIERTLAPSQIEHDNLRRSNTVLAFYRPGGPPSMDLSMAVMMKALGQLNWPPGYTLEMRGDMTEMMDSFARLFQGLALALIFIFLILVAQFRSFWQPLQMLLSLPLEMTGVLLALFLAHQAFSSVSILGVIVLTGMDATAAILLIDHIISYRAKGLPRDEAIQRACRERLRPILMTAVITILVMLRIAILQPAGLDAYAPLATVIIGGLAAGTFLSLLVIPVMHTLIDDLVQGRHSNSKWRMRNVK